MFTDTKNEKYQRGLNADLAKKKKKKEDSNPWLIHVNVWQNQYSIVKQNKVKLKKKKNHNIYPMKKV